MPSDCSGMMSIQKIAGVSKKVTSYLKLVNYNKYAGYCLRRTATIPVDNGGETFLKRHSRVDVKKCCWEQWKFLTHWIAFRQNLKYLKRSYNTKVHTMCTRNTILDHTNTVMNIDNECSGLNIQNSVISKCTFYIAVINK